MKLIDDWKQVWKWYSTHAMVIYMGLVSYYVSLEPTVKEQIPDWMLYTGIVIAGITFIIARIVKQGETTSE